MGELAEGDLGFETPRQRVANSVPRMAPCLLTVQPCESDIVSLIDHAHRNRKTNEPELGHRPGYEGELRAPVP